MPDFFDIENELKKLTPRRPSPELMARVERAVENGLTAAPTAGVVKKPRAGKISWFSLGLGLAAATVFVLLARVEEKPVRPATPTVAQSQPVVPQQSVPTQNAPVPGYAHQGLTQVVYSERDEGLRFPRNEETPVRRYRVTKHETLEWRNPQTGATLRISYPAEEIRHVPVSGY